MRRSFVFLLLCAALASAGAELFVGPGQKYATVVAGIAALKDGDTLTIAPGRYYETIDVKKKLKNVTIRAQFPGSVLIHGDKPAPKFTKVPGCRFVYEADWKDNVNAVNERDTFRVYFPAASVRFLEFNFGYWFRKEGKLYISTTDGKAPETHDLSVSVLSGNGLRIWDPENIVVEGLSFTGFYSHFAVDAWSGRNGLQLQRPKKCVIRNCSAFFNSNGISLSGGEDSAVDGCTSFANGSQSPSSGGNIIGWSGKRNEIRNCLSMYKIYTGGSQGPIGIRFYGIMDHCKVLNCRSFGEDGINIKGTPGGSYAENNYCERHINIADSRNNLFTHVNGYNKKDSSPLIKLKKAEWGKHFADPENHDFRPLAAVKTALPQKIASGDSILLPAGFAAPVSFKADDVTLTTRGAGKRAAVKGGKIAGNNIKLENVEITAPLEITGSGILLRNCVVRAKITVNAKNVQIVHCDFKVRPDFGRSTGFRHSNLGLDDSGPLAVLEKGSTFDGMPAGPCRVVRAPRLAEVTGPFVHSVSDTAVNIEWWTGNTSVSTEILWGDTPKCAKRAGQPFSGGNWHSMSLTGLKPGTKYYFKLNSRTPLRTHHSNAELEELDRSMKRQRISSDTVSFTTLKAKAAPRTLRVKGPEISPVLDQARPGDTVLIPGGVYTETLYVRSAGITLRNVPGEKVILDGKRTLDSGVVLENKNDVVVDGLFFRHFVGGSGAGVVVNGGEKITLKRCFYDGRSSSYTPVFVKANFCKDLTLDNCMITRGFHGVSFYRCANLKITNCVWLDNQINHFYIHNLPEEKVIFTKNIVFDNIPVKVPNPLLTFWHLESLRESSNCFCLRLPGTRRLAVGFTREKGQAVNGADTYFEFLKRTGTKKTSFFANPKLKAVPRILEYKSPVFARPGKFPDRSEYAAELRSLENEFAKVELGKQKKSYDDWDFSGFFPADPRCVKEKIGFLPSLFRNGVAN